jgi:phage tail-like protein
MSVRPDAVTYEHLSSINGALTIAERDGIEVDASGALVLGRLPSLADVSSGTVAPVPGLNGPAAVGVDPCDGTIYVADPGRHRILRVDPCDGRTEPLPCLRGPGSELGELREPRGVIVGPRRALYVADSGNARVQVFDIATGQRRGVWGQASLMDEPSPSDAPGRFRSPWDLAVDAADRVYVADPGTREAPDGGWLGGRVQRFDADGRVDVAFGSAMQAATPTVGSPVSISIVRYPGVTSSGGDERLLVLDQQPPRMLVFDLAGNLDATATATWARVAGATSSPLSMVTGGGLLYVADATGQILVFDTTGKMVAAQSGDASLAGLAIDCQGRLVARPSGDGAVQRGLGLPSRTTCGTVLLGPFSDPIDRAGGDTRWQRLHLALDPVPDGAYVQLYTLTSDTYDGAAGGLPPSPLGCNGTVASDIVQADDRNDAPVDRWRAAPRDAADVQALNVAARWLWVAIHFEGDGTVTPTLRRLTVHFDEPGWIAQLPALYRRDAATRTTLERLLSLYESAFDEDSALLDELPALFDSQGAPDVPRGAGWLDWLAGWEDAELDERWSAKVRRSRVATAFRAHAVRGTPRSLAELVELYTGVRPLIDEPALHSSPWVLGSGGLGMSTSLTVAAADGAVLGTTAVLDRSHLTRAEDYGEPLFDDLAHRFVVQVYAADVPRSEDIAQVRRVIDREKPAHTVYDLCVIAPRLRVGVQASVGIDALVGGPLPAAPLGDGLALGSTTVLAGDPMTRPALSVGARVGTRSTLA